jgi:hypothetical protein
MSTHACLSRPRNQCKALIWYEYILVYCLTVRGGDSSEVHFSPIPDESIDFLVEEGECFHCAGGLMVEHPKMNSLVGGNRTEPE